MILRNDRELANTQRKLRLLEESYEEARHDTEDDEHLRELEMHSLKRLINQLKEEIARYEAHQPSNREAARS
jgi:hypothetical protein